ncbi:hypothetical protein ACFDTO_34045 [Microbacteriaceae bacterium 4G12]|uniref:Uncharacterized protein n=5 Tax=Bacteria TaxID=2 RepID=A0A7K0GNH0_PARDI|nr:MULTISPECIES: hypothetical protein [Bacteria]MRY60503.1 hypothetical protein [Parabacteroides distasonis]MTU02570.1 hypothetical protein [Parasutterella excrementihominis]MTU24689.1 hypothetical protein [Parasutterella excrementihominis]MTU44597.1 hypothetical protein [Parasutterella excrementihominis]
MFSYIFQGRTHTDTTRSYMNSLGMTQEQVDSVLQQKDFEEAQNLVKRKEAYRLESDPLFMEWQYDNTPESEQVWRDKVAEIKARYPLPSESQPAA